MWIDSLPNEQQAALFTSLITISGFVIAFNSATANWRDQFKAQMKSQVAGEIEGFFGPLSVSINEVTFFTQSAINTVNNIQHGTTFDEASFSIGHLQGQQSRFLAARNHISQASSEVHQLIGRNYNILSAGWGIIPSIQASAEALRDISETIWIQLPVVNMNNQNHVQDFLNQIDVAKYHTLLQACERNAATLAGLAGGIRGYLLAPIVGFNLSMFLNLIFNSKEFRKAFTEFQKKTNKKSFEK